VKARKTLAKEETDHGTFGGTTTELSAEPPPGRVVGGKKLLERSQAVSLYFFIKVILEHILFPESSFQTNTKSC